MDSFDLKKTFYYIDGVANQDTLHTEFIDVFISSSEFHMSLKWFAKNYFTGFGFYFPKSAGQKLTCFQIHNFSNATSVPYQI